MHDVIQAAPPQPKGKTRKRKTILKAVGIVGAIALVVIGIKAFQIKTMMGMKMQMPATTVTSAPVKEEDWAPSLTAVGSISPVQGAMVSAELGGIVAEIGFQNGGVAKKGDVLVRLDTSSEDAQLHSAEADLELAKADVMRARDLAARKVVSKAEIDAAESKFQQKQGTVENMRAMITKKEVRAPFDGQLGIRQVNVGQMINAGQQVVPLQSLDPVYVDFAVPQQELAKLKPGLEVHVHSDAISGRDFVGKLTAIDPSVDQVTRNVSVQGTLENPDHVLRPGMFAKVEVFMAEKQKTFVIPGSAVSYAPYGDSVFVIEKQKDPKTGQESQVLRQQIVRVGEARGDLVAITQGLKPGEMVVGTGVFKLRNGMAVTINNALAPKPELNPTPADS